MGEGKQLRGPRLLIVRRTLDVFFGGNKVRRSVSGIGVAGFT